MKNIITTALLFFAMALFWGCQKTIDYTSDDYGNYPGGTISPYISLFDIRSLYKGQDITLSTENMLGSAKIAAVVVSDHSGNNLPEGLLVVQDSRRLSQLRGISLPIGADAASYVPGDSVIIDVVGAVLKKVDGILQITGITKDKITKVSSGNNIPINRVRTVDILANPDAYESIFSVIVKGGFVPIPKEAEVLSGDKSLNDGFGKVTLHTEADATFADSALYGLANYYGIFFNKQVTADSIAPVFRVRKAADIVLLSSTITVTPIVIAGFMSDVNGGDGNNEYIQLLATKDIDFSITPYSVVVCNNATNTQPAPNGWATGVVVSGSITYYRSYKFNLTTGTAKKGTYFYVGGTSKLINGANSTSIASSNWIRVKNYTTTAGDGFGPINTGLFANIGNASGVAVFNGTAVTLASEPIDVIMVGISGALLGSGTPPAWGYRITNTDWYDVKNPITIEDQPFYSMGSNTINLKYNTENLGYYNILGGVYNITLGRWTAARSQINLILRKDSPITEIEGDNATKIQE